MRQVSVRLRLVEVVGAAVVALLALAPATAIAYHDGSGSHPATGAISLDVVVPIVVVVVGGIVMLGIWSRKKPKGKAARRRSKKRRKT